MAFEPFAILTLADMFLVLLLLLLLKFDANDTWV